MANMIPISTVTVGSGGAATIDFTNIPQNYTDLVLKLSARNSNTNYASAGQLVYVYPNNSTGTRSGIRLQGDGSATSSSSLYYGLTQAPSDATATTFGNSELYIPNYTSSNYKSISIDAVYENNGTTATAGIAAQLWSNTSPITSINLTPYGGTFAQYSSATLYGIRKY